MRSHVVPVCMPPVRRSASPRRSSTWECLHCVRATSRRTSSTNRRPSTRCTCVSARPASSCSCRRTYRVRRSSPTTRTSRRTRTPGSPTPSGSRIPMIDRLGLTADSLVIEVASNDGYLLQHFLARGIPVLGIEPAKNVAEVAQSLGIANRRCSSSAPTTGQRHRRAPWPRRSGRGEQRFRPRP